MLRVVQKRATTEKLKEGYREQKMLKRHLPRVIYHQVYWYTKMK